MPDDVKHQLRLSSRLVMPPHLQLAILLLGMPADKLDKRIASTAGIVRSSEGPDPMLEPIELDDGSPWRFGEVPPGITADVWVDGDPPIARANRAALPELRVVDSHEEARVLLLALRERSRICERVVAEIARARPQLAIAQTASEIDPVPLRVLADATRLHESTIERVARGCSVESRHRAFRLIGGRDGVGVADR